VIDAPQQPGTCGGCPLGPIPETTRGRRAWRQAAAAIEDYRRSYQITDSKKALGPVPREPAQRAAWRHARTTAQRVQERQRTAHREERIATALPGALDRSQRDHAPRRTAAGGSTWRAGAVLATGAAAGLLAALLAPRLMGSRACLRSRSVHAVRLQ